jgi:hypothetical protein
MEKIGEGSTHLNFGFLACIHTVVNYQTCAERHLQGQLRCSLATPVGTGGVVAPSLALPGWGEGVMGDGVGGLRRHGTAMSLRSPLLPVLHLIFLMNIWIMIFSHNFFKKLSDIYFLHREFSIAKQFIVFRIKYNGCLCVAYRLG